MGTNRMQLGMIGLGWMGASMECCGPSLPRNTPVLPDLDLVLVMTVNPGFGHQHFIHSTLAKIERVRRIIQQK